MLCSANCGNLASTTNRISNIWDYRNRLTSYGTSLATTTFGYDHGVERVWKATGSATTTYASKLYNTDGTTITKHIFSPMGDMIATIIGTGASTTATTTYIHTDHLGGTAATTNVEGDVVELSDFHPYGSPRVSLNYIGTPEQRKYAGTERDASLDYMLNRYYSSDQGRFINQDRVFWQLPSGILLDPQQLNSARTMGGLNSGFASGWSRNTQSRGSSISQAEYLADPQMQNSYAYARGNPITMKDPEGLWGVFFQADLSGAAGLGSGFAGQGSVGGGFVTDRNPFTDTTDIGGYTSYGGLVGGAFHSTTLQGSRSGPNPYTVLGLSGGLSGGVTLTDR